MTRSGAYGTGDAGVCVHHATLREVGMTKWLTR